MGDFHDFAHVRSHWREERYPTQPSPSVALAIDESPFIDKFNAVVPALHAASGFYAPLEGGVGHADCRHLMFIVHPAGRDRLKYNLRAG